MEPLRNDRRTRLAILALPESTPATVFGLYEVFSLAGIAWHMTTGEGERNPLFDVSIVTTDGKTVIGPLGTPITPHAALADSGPADIVAITDLMLDPGTGPLTLAPETRDWLHRQYENGAVICSVCTGTVALAAAGLLDGHQATTHWSACDLFRKQFPQVHLQSERILVPTGDGHRIITCGGSASWEDLALHLIARFCGREEAVRIAKVYLFGDRSEGQLPFAAMNLPRRHTDAVIADCQQWVAAHYDDANPVARMVERSGLAERTFKRRFRAATGYAPMDYVQTVRIEEAKQMLESGDGSTDDIAAALGYEDPTYFRRLFKKRTGITPGRYRQKFRLLVAG